MPTRKTEPSPRAKPTHLRTTDLRAAAQLATQATLGVTRIVEGVHQSVLRTLGAPGGATPGTTRGITGLVYRSITGVTRTVGRQIDRALAQLEPALGTMEEGPPPSPERAAVLAALNGVIGDRLAADGSPLATAMALVPRGPQRASGRTLLLMHGLCMHDLQWQARTPQGKVVDHGQTLGEALGLNTLYLRYNTGLHVSQNGRALALLLEQHVAAQAQPIAALQIVGHSMGGLVARSAVHYATEAGMRWPSLLTHLVFLGTPHHGAPLEQAGHGVELLLGSNRFSAPFIALARLRSNGITDLRHGHVLDDHWQQAADGKGAGRVRRAALPLPAGVACFTVAATLAGARGTAAQRLLGDGLVPLNSALGLHASAARRLAFASDRQYIAYRTGHLQLLASEAVVAQVRHWLAS